VGNLPFAVLVEVAQVIPVCRLMVGIITLLALVATGLLLTSLEQELPMAGAGAGVMRLATLAPALLVGKLLMVARVVAVMAVQAAQDQIMEPLVLLTQAVVVEQVAAREVLVQAVQAGQVL
jgi:hypothetical protein